MKRLLTLILFTMVPLLAHAETYYVAKSGSNSNTCAQAKTATTAKLTIGAGTACLAAGDTLIIGSGTYAEGISMGAIPSGPDDAHHTIVRGADGVSVKLTGVGTNGDVVEISNRVFVTLAHMELIGGVDGGAGTALNLGVRLGEGPCCGSTMAVSYILLEDLIIHHTGGIYSGANPLNNHLTMRRLDIHNCGVLGSTEQFHAHCIYLSGTDHIVEDSDIYLSESHGVHIYNQQGVGADRIIVRNNKIHDNGSFGVMLSSGTGNIAYNNFIYANNQRDWGAGGIRTYGGCVGCQILNNTVYGNINYGIWVQDGSYGIVENNISYANSSAAIVDNGVQTTLSNNMTTDPSFMNAAALDFRLAPGSDAIVRGIGASEYGASEVSSPVSPPAPPANLRIVSTQ